MTALLANPALPGLLKHLANPSSNAIGALGEQLCYHALTARGYLVSNAHPKEHRGDLRIITRDGQILRVEVKTARRSADGYYRATLRKPGKTDHGDSDVVILLCVMEAGYVVPFVIPTPLIIHKNTLAVGNPDTYRGKFARYRQRLYSLNLERERERE